MADERVGFRGGVWDMARVRLVHDVCLPGRCAQLEGDAAELSALAAALAEELELEEGTLTLAHAKETYVTGHMPCVVVQGLTVASPVAPVLQDTLRSL